MENAFVFGVSVSGKNFTDRVIETERIKRNFLAGLNTILISPRRIGKTSLVKKVCSEINDPEIKIIFIDIYDCRDEYDFYNKFASATLKGTASGIDQALNLAKDVLGRIAPKISISPDMNAEYSLSLGITPRNSSPEEILNLPEKIAEKKGIHIIICLDEFQQIGEFSDSLTVQKRLRSVWQHQKHTSYCLFGSKKHMMEKLFLSKRMPFYQFGDTIHLGVISTPDWVSYIQSRFSANGKRISAELAAKICSLVQNYSSYVQQLAWNVFTITNTEVTEENLQKGVKDLIAQNSALYMQQIENLTSYQMNFLRAICDGVNSGFSSNEILTKYNMGSKSNISRIRNVLIEKELITKDKDSISITDPVFRLWFIQECMR